MNNADKFKQIFGLYATELWAMSEEDFLAWLNAERDVPDTNVGELISRQAAIASAISGRIRTIQTREGGEDWIRVKEVRESLMELPPIDAVPVVRCKDCKHAQIDTIFDAMW